MACDPIAGTADCAVTSYLTQTFTSDIITTYQTTLTKTQQIVTTIQATLGQTVTISPPSPPWYLNPTASEASTSGFVPTKTISEIIPSATTYTSSVTTTATPTPTVTVTEILIFFRNAGDDIYSTSTLTIPAATTTTTSRITSNPLIIVVGEQHGNGWNTWTNAERGALIAGCVIAFLISLLLAAFWMLRRRQVWIANDWSVNSHPGYIHGHQQYGMVHYPNMRGGSGGNEGLKRSPRMIRSFELEGNESDMLEPQDTNGNMETLDNDGRPAFYKPPLNKDTRVVDSTSLD